MTKYTLSLEEKQTIEWLDKLHRTMYEKAKADPSRFADIGFIMEDLKQGLENVKAVTSNEEKRQALKAAKEKKATKAYTPNLCPDHPTYGGERVPSIDCPGHWAAYKKMNPMKYEAARRKFDRQHKTDSK